MSILHVLNSYLSFDFVLLITGKATVIMCSKPPTHYITTVLLTYRCTYIQSYYNKTTTVILVFIVGRINKRVGVGVNESGLYAALQ